MSLIKKFILRNNFILNIILRLYITYYNRVNKKNNVIKSYINVNKLESHIVIEKNVQIDATMESIGIGTYINEYTLINNCKIIGKFCSIAPGVKIGMGAHSIDWVSTSPVFYSPKRGVVQDHKYTLDKPVIIQNDVWIASNAVIMPGVKLGNGCVIGAGAIVTKDVPDYAIATGVPAQIRRYRFDKSTIRNLLDSKWWEKDLTTLKNTVQYMNDPQRFLENLE